jgi:hypothetical protein
LPDMTVELELVGGAVRRIIRDWLAPIRLPEFLSRFLWHPDGFARRGVDALRVLWPVFPT